MSLSTSSAVTIKCPSRQSHSDYCSLQSASSSDDECDVFEETPIRDFRQSEPPVGTCPHCEQIFEQPVSLPCGHSLCRLCCNQLLFTPSHHAPPPDATIPPRPRMGISCRARSAQTGGLVMHRSPQCPVCRAGPSIAGPVPNVALEHLLRNMRTFQWHASSSSSKSSTWKWDDDGPIQECRVAVLGARGVGKTCFTRVQNGNDVMFPDAHDDREERDVYMVDIADGMSVERAAVAARGIIVMYSVTDRQSFYRAADIYKRLELVREHNQPVLLVASKKDVKRQRVVTLLEGQQLARNFGCPFFEVSAKNNDCVHETFVELVARIQQQHNQFRNVVKMSLV